MTSKNHEEKGYSLNLYSQIILYKTEVYYPKHN